MTRYFLEDEGFPEPTDDDRLGDWVRWKDVRAAILDTPPRIESGTGDQLCFYCGSDNLEEHAADCLWAQAAGSAA